MSSYISADDYGGFAIFSGSKILYSSNGNTETQALKVKISKPQTKVRASAKNKRIIEFELFEDLLKMETDPFWITILDDAAQGKFPRNFKYQNGILSSKLRSKPINVPLKGTNAEILEIVKNFFLKCGGIESPLDVQNKKEKEKTMLDQIIEDDIEINWSQIRSDKQKMVMISLYVEQLGEKYKLSIDERKGLVQNIKIGILAGYLNTDNIVIKNNNISEIFGLNYDKETKQFSIDKKQCSLTKVKPKYVASNTKDYESEHHDFSTLSGDYDSSLSGPCSNKVHKQDLIRNWNRFLNDIGKKKV
jgi:hypothetical protein